MRHVLDHAAHDAGLDHAHHRQAGRQRAKSNWSTPAPGREQHSRFGKALAHVVGGSQAARKRTRAGSPMSGQMRKSSLGARRRNTSAHARPRTGSDL
jgi:hypothetical protein